MGGISIARASEEFPHLIAVAVYVTAYMFRGGESKQREQEMLEVNSDTAKLTEFNFNNGILEPPTSELVLKKFQKDRFYGTTSTVDATLASLLLRPFPSMARMNVSVETTEERYGVVPRIFIKTTKDNAISLAEQEELIDNSPPQKVYSLPTDHSPFLSAPEKLHSLLLEIAHIA